jgi:hypothetical protein
MNDPCEPRSEALRPNPTPEEVCLSELLDLSEFQKMGPGKKVSDFYSVLTGGEAPKDLRTRISTRVVKQEPQDLLSFSPQRNSYVEGFEITATIVVDFDTDDSEAGGMLNLDFVKTPGGLQLMEREYFWEEEERIARYTRRVSQEELAALARDSAVTRELVIEEDAEIMKLGALVETQAEDGTRRFHIGDILSITTGKLVSPRLISGVYDILGYMTDDTPYTTQLGRFKEECLPYLEQTLGDAIKPYSEIPDTITDSLSLYKWLHSVTDGMGGDPFLNVHKIDEKDHSVMDPMTELELDHGPEIIKKFIQIEPGLTEQDEEQ